MKGSDKYIQDISLLYELSLSVGKSLNFNENCQHFLNILINKKNLDFGSIWLDTDDTYTFSYSTHLDKVKVSVITKHHPITQQLENRTAFAVNENDPNFDSYITEYSIEGGTYIIYRLPNIGFLKLYTHRTDIFNPTEVNQLVNIIQKFSLILNGCNAFGQLRNETQQRIEAQSALSDSEDRYRSVLQELSEGVLLTDLEGNISFVNRCMEKNTGYRKEQLIGQEIIDLLKVPEQKVMVNDIFINPSKNSSESFVVWFNHASGNKWLAKVNTSPYLNSNGQVAGTIALVKDISAQEQAERRIIENEQKLRKIIDTSLDAVINIDEKGRIIEWNQQAEKIFGYTRDEAMYHAVCDLICPNKQRPVYSRVINRLVTTHKSPILNKRIEIIGMDKSFREFPVELSITPIKLNGNYFFSGFLRDITERKEAETELISAKQQADQARVAEQQFLANMSHEIRTPMNAVIGMTHLLYESNPTEKQKEFLDSLRFSADSLMGIINNILDISKIEAQELEFEKSTFSLLELLRSLQQTFQFKVKDKPVSVVLDIDNNIKNQLIGDSVRLNQILTNLLGNSCKFTKRGTVGVDVKLLAATGDNYILQFSVHDTGIGIETDQIERIFENFKQAEVGITRKFGGTGLGLAIVKQLVELQGGTISVESEKGRGSIFKVVMPFGVSDLPQTGVQIESEVKLNEKDMFKSIELLVVEDNPMNQKLISKILDLWECPFQIAPSGEMALEMTAEKRYDLILMDIHMPEMDGCETTTIIRQDYSNPNHQIPIIALTAAALLEEKNRAFAAGMDDFLTKPFSPNNLKKVLIKWLNLDKVQNEDASTIRQPSQEGVKFDFSSLNTLAKGDQHFLKDMIEIFVEEIPVAIHQLEGDYDKENWKNIRSTAHRIKSNFMMMGMKTQQNEALSIEKNIGMGIINSEDIYSRIQKLKSDSKVACTLLQKKLAQM